MLNRCAALILAVVPAIFAQDSIALRGSVIALDGATIEGATVRLATRGNACLSGVDGAYLITSASAALPASRAVLPAFSIRVSGCRIDAILPAATPATIELTDMFGRRTMRLHEGWLTGGEHVFRFAPGSLSAGLYVLRLRTPAATIERPVMYAGGILAGMRHGASTASGRLGKATASVCDTLVATRPQYDTARVPVCSLLDTTDIIMIRSSGCVLPPIPDVAGPAVVIGDGTAASCTEQALRDAIAAGGRIVFNSGCKRVTITLSAPLEVRQNTSIDGAGRVTIDGAGEHIIFYAAQYDTLHLQGLTLTNGNAHGQVLDGAAQCKGGAVHGGWRAVVSLRSCRLVGNRASGSSVCSDDAGGAVFVPSESELCIAQCYFAGNSATEAGAIDNLLSDLTLVNSVFEDNRASGANGGAVSIDGAKGTAQVNSGTIRICGCVFTANAAMGHGGAVYDFLYDKARSYIDKCAFTADSTLGPDGMAFGGALSHGNGALALNASSFERNFAAGQGGAMFVDSDTPVVVTNCTFFGNRAETYDKSSGFGGALKGRNFSIIHCTIAGNYAGHSPGGVFDDGGVSLANSIVAFNTTGNPWNIENNCLGLLGDGGSNIQYPDNAPSNPGQNPCTASIIVADPLLDSLADNGGYTKTMMLHAGSPAIDKAPKILETDQRGIRRGTLSDIGAVEARE